jgi:outer membrane protein OmpA-like peptidoglycan-associated protein
MKRGAVVFVLAVAAFGCGPKNYVVLLDNPGGGSGKVIVATKKGEQVLDKSGSATTFNRANSKPSDPWELGVEKIKEVFGRAFGARPDRFVKYTFYFKSGTTTIEPKSMSEFQAMLATVGKRPGVDATVAGHADRTASAKQNERLSLKRAFKVRDALVEAGVPLERIEIDSYGESRPAVPTADDVPEMRNRRVEVVVR